MKKYTILSLLALSCLSCNPLVVSTTNKEDAEKKFKEISDAYSILSDPEKRKVYDQYGEDAVKDGGGGGVGEGLGESAAMGFSGTATAIGFSGGSSSFNYCDMFMHSFWI